MTDLTNINAYRQKTTLQIHDMTITGADGKQQSIKDLFVTCNIYEDIFSHALHGDVILMESLDLINTLKLDGWQALNISFQSNNDSSFKIWEKEFYCNGINGISRAPNAGSVRLYRLSFVSEMVFYHLNNRIQRSYRGMTESAIVQDIGQNILRIKDLDVEASKYVKNMVFPDWQPFDVISHCCKTAVRGSGYESTNYVFFETIDGTHFWSIDKMVEQTPEDIPISSSVVSQLNADGQNNAARRQAERIEGQQHVDLLANSKQGMHGSRFVGVDIFSKTWSKFDWAYQKEFGSLPKIDASGNRILTAQPPDFEEQATIIGPWQSKPRGYNSDYNHLHVHKRRPMMAIWNNNVFHLQITGDSSLRAGMKIDFNLPKADSSDSTGGMDESLSGSYIITAIHNQFGQREHNQILDIRKGAWKA